MKQKLQSGFTIIEMLTVIGIMGLVASIFIANFAAFRGPRDLRIATNELVSNMRKIQSYTLSSRNSPSGQGVKYYILKISAAAFGNNYQIQAINSDYSFDSNIETVNMPSGILVSTTASTKNAMQLEQPIGGSITLQRCVQIAFSLPFGKIYMDGTCSIDGSPSSIIRNPASMVNLANSKVTISLLDFNNLVANTVIVNGISGAVCVPTQGNSC